MNSPSPTTPIAPWFILGFLLLAFGSLGCLLVEIVLSPGTAMMDVWKYWLLAGGWGASVVFAAAYHFAPIMAGAPLWSPTSGWLHLALHSLGLGLLARGHFAGADAAAGSVFMACGAGLFALNFMVTAGIRNRWTPANLLFLSSLVWLGVELVVTTQLSVQAKPRGLMRSPEWMAHLSESALVIGFLWQATMAITKQAVERHLAPPRWQDGMAWVGFASLNLGLAAIFWLPEAPWAGAVQSALVVIGLFTLVATLAAAISGSRQATTPVAGFSIGLVAAALLLAGSWPFPNAMGNGLAAALHVLGISWICLTARLVPLAFGDGTPGSLLAEHSMPSLVFGASFSSLLLGVAALAGSGEGQRVGAALLLATIVWWLITLSPAWCRLWGTSSSTVAKPAAA